jgi:hypothetical protein
MVKDRNLLAIWLEGGKGQEPTYYPSSWEAVKNRNLLPIWLESGKGQEPTYYPSGCEVVKDRKLHITHLVVNWYRTGTY